MELWLDAQISPIIASWIRKEFEVDCIALREINLQYADDPMIFKAAKAKGTVVVMTKDIDFCNLLSVLKSPPKIIWLTFGNCSNDLMKDILTKNQRQALSVLAENDLVEISG